MNTDQNITDSKGRSFRLIEATNVSQADVLKFSRDLGIFVDARPLGSEIAIGDPLEFRFPGSNGTIRFERIT